MFLGTLKYFRKAQGMDTMCPWVMVPSGKGKVSGWLSDIPVEGYIPWVQIIFEGCDWGGKLNGLPSLSTWFFHDEFGIRWRVKFRPRIRGVWLTH